MTDHEFTDAEVQDLADQYGLDYPTLRAAIVNSDKSQSATVIRLLLWKQKLALNTVRTR